jgi:hypothetical protein
LGDSAGESSGQDLLIQTVVGALVGGAGLAGPDAGAVATALAPSVAVALDRAVGAIRYRRRTHAEETLVDAISTSSVSAEDFISMALEDDDRSELLVKVLTSAQDTAVREKRRALAIALADGICGTTDINDEILFIRAISNLDRPDIAVLKVIGSVPPPDRVMPRAWTRGAILQRLPQLGEALSAVLSTLELHTLIFNMPLAADSGQISTDFYRVTSRGRQFLNRLAFEP